MKKNSINFLFFFAALCPILLLGQNKKDKIQKIEKEIFGFHSISARGTVKIYIRQTGEEKMEIEASEDLLEQVVAQVKDGILEIYTKTPNLNLNEKTLKVNLNVKNLKRIEGRGAAEFFTENKLNIDRLELSFGAFSDATLEVDARELICDISGSSDLALSGDTYFFKAAVKGSGDLRAFKLKAEIGNIELSGSGDATVFIDGELESNVAGSGNLSYKGNPILKKVLGKAPVSGRDK